MNPRTGILPRSELRGRLDPRFLLETAEEAPVSRWGSVRLGELATRIQYGSSTLASEERVGLPMLRMNNIKNDVWDFSDLKYVALEPSEAAKYELLDGDILINRTNGSRELVGKSQVFREKGRWVFASYLIRVAVDASRADPEFVSAYLNSDAGRAQVTATSRQALQTNVSATELRNIRVPLPPLEEQRALASARSTALSTRGELLTAADRAIDEIGHGFSTIMGLERHRTAKVTSFPVKLGELIGRRLDPGFHRPQAFSAGRPTLALREFAECDPKSTELIPPIVCYVGLPQCDNLDVRSIESRPSREVRGRKSFRRGDLLVARIEPSIFNRKYPWARSSILDGLGDIYTSTEFYVLRADSEHLAYLLGALRSDYLQAQIAGRTTGTSGRRRLDKASFLELAIPRPTKDELSSVADHVRECLQRSEDSMRMANQIWRTARRDFEQSLEGASID